MNPLLLRVYTVNLVSTIRGEAQSEAFIKLAMIHLMLNRLDSKGTDAEFHYRKAA